MTHLANTAAARQRTTHTPRLFLLGLAVAAFSCSSGGGAGGDGGVSPGPWATLSTLSADGEIRCAGERCCFKSCYQSRVMCVSRDVGDIALATDGWPGCAALVFPEWFYANDCYVYVYDPTSQEYQPGQGLTQGPYPRNWNSFISGDGLHLFVECFCGRGPTTFASDWSYGQAFPGGCADAVNAPSQLGDLEAQCASISEWCAPCTPSCAGRECGSNGCGGSCGTCSGAATCGASGTCVGSGGQTCSGCLSSCSGDPLCCTGCGCYCEAECGGSPYGC